MALWFKLLMPAMRHFRRQRASVLKSLIPDIEQKEILDLGGSLHFWDAIRDVVRPQSVKILNVAANVTSLGPSMADADNIIIYDGKHIPFGDKSIELIFCNSVIEHVPLCERHQLAGEIRRASRGYIVQTPAREFIVEPHFLAPFLHWIPRNLARRLAVLTPWALMRSKGKDAALAMFDEVNLLSRRELQDLFPEAKIVVERVVGLPKSYTAVWS